MNLPQLKFLVDVGVGKAVENYLLEAGYDTKAVRIKNCFCVFQNDKFRIRKITL